MAKMAKGEEKLKDFLLVSVGMSDNSVAKQQEPYMVVGSPKEEAINFIDERLFYIGEKRDETTIQSMLCCFTNICRSVNTISR